MYIARSRYSNYLLFGKVIINSAMLHGNWNYNATTQPIWHYRGLF
jgi:hypothetical protein